MPTAASLLVTVAACGLVACGEPPPAETEAHGEQAAGEEAAGDEGTPDEPARSSRPGGLSVTRLSGSDTAPATQGREQASATARAQGMSVILSISNFIYYCAPPPAFTARMEADLVVVQAERPTSPATRCIGPHAAVLRIDGVPAGAHTVSVRNQQGQEVATTEVTMGG